MAGAVMLGTTWALILPAITLETCDQEEHTHAESCYAQVTEVPPMQLQCGFQVHRHDGDCRDGDGTLLCGQEDFALHSHNDLCLDASGALNCPLPVVEAHEHSPDCWQEATEQELTCTLHVHTEECFTLSEESSQPVLTCPEAESHQHDGACYTTIETEPVPVCGKEELLPHAHSEDAGCYTYENEVQALICQKTVLLEHTHDETCLAAGEPLPGEDLVCQIPEHTHSPECQPAEDAPQVLALENPAGAQDSDLPVVTGDGIRFRLFNYSLDINKTGDKSAWRPISSYFTFRNSALPKGDAPSDTVHIPTWNSNAAYDEDGFTANHATVEWMLSGGLPVLSLTRNPVPNGAARPDPGVDAATRSLAYLFSAGDPGVTAYSPGNTILQKSGSRYYYNSQLSAVDYDPDADLFRVRGYAERNSTTAGYGSAYGDFLPFTYTGGQVIGDSSGTAYHVESADVDYWFGMTMEVDFFQTKGGQLDGGDMVFNFSGDDDVWVFVDDVLVLDLGGTHGTATGSINFATGEVTQYLSWNGGSPSSTTTSFPTTIRHCFDQAGATPNGGWNGAGTSFADYTEHTLKFFYLERGSAVANCLLDFRLPTLPDKSLTVTKDLVPSGEEAVEDFIEDSLSYKFRVVKADENGKATGELFLKPGTAYTLLSGGSTSGTGTIDADGYFTLKAGQSAQFPDMLAKGGGAVDYIVQEVMPTGLTGQYAGVEYQVSGSTGSIETETGTLREFTTYDTGLLSAEETQTVTYRNKVDVSQLGTLKITKQAAPAAQFPEGQIFQIQVKLGGQLLPVGSPYRIEGEPEDRIVTTAGVIELQIGQTAVLDGILSGTAYEITELGASDGSFTASYSGDAASGEFGLNDTLHITVTNASYDFSGSIPIYKQALDHSGTSTFHFLVEQAERNEDGSWVIGAPLPGTSLSVSGDAEHRGTITIGYDAGTEGIFYYKISERPGDGAFVYDDTFYIAEVTVTKDGTAAVTAIFKNGVEETDKILFVNRRTTTLQVTKEVTGALYEGSFPFTATVTLNGQPFPLAQPAPGAPYSVSGNTISFALSHDGTISIPGIPCHAEVTVTETRHDGFTTWYRVDGLHPQNMPGDSVSVIFGTSSETVHFVNNGGFQLPKTGGVGRGSLPVSGLLLMAASLFFNFIKRRRKEGGDHPS